MSFQHDPATRERYPALDGVRGLAVLLVLVWHYIPCQMVDEAGLVAPILRRLLYVTGSGVDLFFALSGFLIVGILMDQKGKANFLRVFYLRRTCRIFPLYFLLLGLFLLADGWQALPEASRNWLFADPMPLWSYATFTQNIFMGLLDSFGPGWLAVTWSLAVEEQFYLLVPLVVLLSGRPALAGMVIAGLIALPFLRMAMPGFHSYVNLPWRADPLLTGAGVAMLVRSEWFTARVRTFKPWIIGTAVILLVGVMAMIAVPGYLGEFDGTWLALLYGVLILMLRLDLVRWITVIFETRALCWMGMLSYGIYMFHQAASGLMHGLIKGQVPRIGGLTDASITLAAAVVTVALAWLSYRFFERPILRFGHRFHYSEKRIPCPSN